MASRALLRASILTEPWRASPDRTCFPRFGGTIATMVRDFSSGRRTKNANSSSSSSASSENAHESPQKDVIKAISEVGGRFGLTTKMVLGGSVNDDSTNEWLILDQKVNTYPTFRGFTAIGTGGDDFVQSMVVAVESVIQHPIPQGKVKQRESSGGKYISVNIGPVQVVSSEQVQAVYNAMRRDDRMKFFM